MESWLAGTFVSLTSPLRVTLLVGSVMYCGAPAFTVGGCAVPPDAAPEETTIVTGIALVYCESLALNCKTYVPTTLKIAVLAAELALLNVTVPGPLSIDHCTVKVPFGKPSSVAVPVSATGVPAKAGKVGLAVTTGGWF
jgi:hypothetical protein